MNMGGVSLVWGWFGWGNVVFSLNGWEGDGCYCFINWFGYICIWCCMLGGEFGVLF